VLPIAIAEYCSNDDSGIDSPLHQNVLFLYSDALAEKSFTRSLIDQSKFQRSDWRKRERERNLLRVRWTASCEHFFGARLLSAPGQTIHFQLTILFFICSRIRELEKYVTRKRRHVLIIHARDYVASLIRTDNFFCSFVRSCAHCM